jgi:hypothetical protein
LEVTDAVASGDGSPEKWATSELGSAGVEHHNEVRVQLDQWWGRSARDHTDERRDEEEGGTSSVLDASGRKGEDG